MIDPALEEMMQTLMMSQSMQDIANMAARLPSDVDDKADLKAAFSVALCDLTRALDENRIQFLESHDSHYKAVFYGLLAILLNFQFDGEIKRYLKEVDAH